MRFFVTIAIVMSLLALAPIMGLAQQNQQPATAQPVAQPANTPPTFSEQDRAAAKKGLQQVGELFGVKKSEPTPAGSQAKQEAPTTMADVADKALTMVGNAVGTIAGIVQKVAPEVWEIMVRQQYAKAIAGIIVPSGSLLLLGLLTLVVKKFWPCDKGQKFFDNCDCLTNRGVRAAWTTLVPTVLAVFCGLWFFDRLADSALYLINPKYYAVKDLLEMLLK